MIREATPGDLPGLLALCRLIHADMRYAEAGTTMDDASAGAMLRKLIESDAGLLSVVILDGEVCGFVAAMLVPSLWDKEHIKCLEIAWHMKPGMSSTMKGRWFVRLQDQLERWATEAGARTLHMGADPRQENMAAASFLDRRGFRLRELNFSKELNHGH